MTARTVVIAALPREIAPLVRGWQSMQPGRGVHVWWNDRAIVATAGMGANRVAYAVSAALEVGPARELVSAGLAGALRHGVDCGRVYQSCEVIDVRTGERFNCSMGEGVLVTSPVIADRAEKKRLLETYAADLVDMEASTVARMAAQQSIPFRCVKAVSDSHDFDMPNLERFVDNEGHFRTRAFAASAAVRPALWRMMLAMGRNSAQATRNLCEELSRQL